MESTKKKAIVLHFKVLKNNLPGQNDNSNVKTGICIVPNAKHYTADLRKVYYQQWTYRATFFVKLKCVFPDFMFALCPQKTNRLIQICFSRAAASCRNRNRHTQLNWLTQTAAISTHSDKSRVQFTTSTTNSSPHGRPLNHGKINPCQFWHYYSYKTNAENVYVINTTSITDYKKS